MCRYIYVTAQIEPRKKAAKAVISPNGIWKKNAYLETEKQNLHFFKRLQNFKIHSRKKNSKNFNGKKTSGFRNTIDQHEIDK